MNKAGNKAIRVLLVEDNAADAELMQAMLANQLPSQLVAVDSAAAKEE